MKKGIKTIITLLSCCLFIGCSSAPKADEEAVDETPKDKSEIFVKTIHDFEGLRVDNLDESENTNFVVYAENTKEIILSDNKNKLVKVEEDTLTYIFDKADDTLKGLQTGDVFWFTYPEEIPQAVAVKVSEIEVDRNQVTIHGDENIELADVFEYVDVDMEVGISQFYLTQLEAGVNLEYVVIDGSEAVLEDFEEEPEEVPGDLDTDVVDENAQENVEDDQSSENDASQDAENSDTGEENIEEDNTDPVLAIDSENKIRSVSYNSNEDTGFSISFLGHQSPTLNNNTNENNTSDGTEQPEQSNPSETSTSISVSGKQALNVQKSAWERAKELWKAGKDFANHIGQIVEDGVKIDIPMGLKFSEKIVVGNNTVKGSAALNQTLESFTIEFRYSKEENFFSSSVVATSQSGFSLKLNGKLLGWNKPIPIGEGTVVAPGCPLIAGKVSLTWRNDISGTVSGQISSTQKSVNGFGVTVANGQAPKYEKIDRNQQPIVKAKLTDLTATIQSGLETEISLGVYLIPGIKELAKVYGALFVGGEFKGEYSPTNVTPGMHPDSIHECDICIDGDVSLIGRVTVGVQLGITKEIDPNANPLGVSVPLGEVRVPGDAFYISLKREGKEGAEFGWGNCPHKLYRVDVTVMNTESGALQDAEVTADYADGQKKEAKTDESGKTQFYMPPGDNLLSARKDGESGTAHVVIGESPVDVVIRIKDTRDLFIIYDDQELNHEGNIYSTDKEPDILQDFVNRYPEAQLIHSSQWDWDEAKSKGVCGRGDLVLVIIEKNFVGTAKGTLNRTHNNSGNYEIDIEDLAYDVVLSLVLDNGYHVEDHTLYRVYANTGAITESIRSNNGAVSDYVTSSELDLWEIRCDGVPYDEAFYLKHDEYDAGNDRHKDTHKRVTCFEGSILAYDYYSSGAYQENNVALRQYVWENVISYLDKYAEDDFKIVN